LGREKGESQRMGHPKPAGRDKGGGGGGQGGKTSFKALNLSDIIVEDKRGKTQKRKIIEGILKDFCRGNSGEKGEG